ncbi:MAG: DNA mismatch repair endonuclease MutL [Parachlamydiales bacterium]|nr:DNA mismatch repair endonuclease MutL [Parachlamydiales bacterium]
MRSKIHILDESLINKIAAGEVIESPASVVKELIENAVDAKAKTIDITISGGGLQCIEVNDDGEGMNAEDMEKSILRHATSKIKNFDDMQKVMTMGFRGEALSSIAAVSKMTLESADGKQGHRLVIETGQVLQRETIARACGTRIEVRSLFHNVPVRKKFQKEAFALTSEIHRLVTQMALAHTHVVFHLRSQNRDLLSVSGTDLKTAIEEIFGEKFSQSLYKIEAKQNAMHLIGYIADPSLAKKNRLGQYLFINHRPVFSAPIAQMVKEAYGTRIEESKYPQCILQLTMPPEEVDVNVHPQKSQVRVHDYKIIRDLIFQGFAKVWQCHAPVSLNLSQSFPLHAPIHAPAQHPIPQYSFSSKSSSVPVQQEFSLEKTFEAPLEPFYIMERYLLMNAHVFFPRDFLSFCIVDLVRAETALLVHSLETKSSFVVSQRLLEPLVVSITPDDKILYEKKQTMLEEVGFETRMIAAHAIAVDTVPFAMEEETAASFITELLHGNISEIMDHTEKRKWVVTVSRHVSLRKKQYSMEEGKEIIRRLQNIKNPIVDPLGRPIIKKIGIEDLKELMS